MAKRKLKQDSDYQNQIWPPVTKKTVSNQTRKITNWNTPGRDGFQGFWIQRFTRLHGRTAFQLNKILNGNEKFPK